MKEHPICFRKCLNLKAACTLMRQGRTMTYTLPELVLHLQNNASDNTYQQFNIYTNLSFRKNHHS